MESKQAVKTYYTARGKRVNNRGEQIKIILSFKDGRVIPVEEFDAEKDLTPEQNKYIISQFETVFAR